MSERPDEAPDPAADAGCDPRGGDWLERPGPASEIVVSSRCRYARNLPRVPFPTRASIDDLERVADAVQTAVAGSETFRGGRRYDMAGTPPAWRQCLRENHLISAELEKAAPARVLHLSADGLRALMVNEEDHVRMFALDAGLRPFETLARLTAMDSELDAALGFAFHPDFGYLTACPTNTGTGLRASVLLHLPGLSAAGQLPELANVMGQHGIAVRGFQGENTAATGDLHQVSNETTLGRAEEDIVKRFAKVVDEIIEMEHVARNRMVKHRTLAVDDQAGRAWGLLSHSRTMPADEAVTLLGNLRLGVGRTGLCPGLTHDVLNRIMIHVQPGHIRVAAGRPAEDPERRDGIRADYLRARFAEFATGGPGQGSI